MNTDKILITEAVERTLSLARECLAIQCLGALTGPPGTGKTIAMQTVEARFGSLGLEGRAHYLRCCPVQGPTRGVRDLLDSMGVRAALVPPGATLQVTVKIALREVQNRCIRLLLLDEIDAWSVDCFQGVLALFDLAQQRNQSVAILFSSTLDVSRWLASSPSGLSRTLRTETFCPLSPELSLAVLREWSEPFARLAEQIEDQDKEATGVLRAIHKTTKGNFRRLSYFARLMGVRHPSAPITSESVQDVINHLSTMP